MRISLPSAARRVLCLALVWRVPAAHAQAAPASPPAATLSLRDALTLAREAGPLRQLADARERAGVGRVREATQWANPTIEWRRENLGSPLQPDIFATLYLPFDLSGRRLALRQAAVAGRGRVLAEATADRRRGELDVARAWLRSAAARGALDVVQEQHEALREIARVDAQRLREGLVAEAVGLRTSLEADRARLALADARREADASRAELARLLGRTESMVGDLAPLELPALPAAPDSGWARAHALAHRPEVQARDAAVREAQRRVAAEQRGVLGEVQLQGGTKETGGFMTGQLGVAMPLPLFNRNTGARQRAAGELAEARILSRDVQLAVSGEVRTAHRYYHEVRAAALDAATFDARGREVARIARVAYREGHATLTELLDAERAAADARQAHLRWAAEAWVARLSLEIALGARLDADSPLDLPLLPALPPA